MRATVFFKTLLISLGIVGVSVGNAHAQSSTVSTATQSDDGITYGDFFLDSPRANQSADWGVWTLSGLGVASLGIALAHWLKSPPAGSPPSWRTPFDLAIFLCLVVLYFLVEIPSQLILRLLGLSGHQLALFQKTPTLQGDGSVADDDP